MLIKLFFTFKLSKTNVFLIFMKTFFHTFNLFFHTVIGIFPNLSTRGIEWFLNEISVVRDISSKVLHGAIFHFAEGKKL